MDIYQQLKGAIGQELGELYMRKVRGFEIVGREVGVPEIRRQAKLDAVVRDGATYRPVEIKLQKYDLETFGKAFEYVVDRLANGNDVSAELNGGQQVQLRKPLLLLWWPPAAGVVGNEDRMARYRAAEVEAIQLGEALTELCEMIGARDLVVERIVRALSGRVRQFFEHEDLGLPGIVADRWTEFIAGLGQGE